MHLHQQNQVVILIVSNSSLLLNDLAVWATGRGLPSMMACALIVVLTILSLVRISMRKSRASMFERADSQFLDAFRGSPHVLAVFQDGAEHPASPHWQIYVAGCRELAFHLVGSDKVEKNFINRLRGAGLVSISQMASVRRAMERAAAETALDLQSAVVPRPYPGQSLTLVGWMLGIIIFAEAGFNPATAQSGLAQLLAPALLPVALSMLLSQVLGTFSSSLLSNTENAVTRLRLFAAELSIMMERTFVNHASQQAELPSVGSMGVPAVPAFSLPPSESLTRILPQ